MGKSKHKKSSWREVNVKDVDNFLEDQRLQQRLGIDFSAKPDHELFVVDTSPLSKEELLSKDKKSAPKRVTRLEKRRRIAAEPPRCFQSLVNTSKVPDPVKKRNHVKPVTLAKRTVDKIRKKGTLKKKFDAAQRARIETRAAKEQHRKCLTEFTKDLWTVEKVQKPLPKEWLSQDTIVCNTVINVKKPPGINPNTPSINMPHPGNSYNPSYKEHRELLENVVKTELKVIKEEKHLNRVTTDMFRRVKPEQFMKEYTQELREGLGDDANNADEPSDGEEFKSINPPVVNKKKDLKKRRHMKEEIALKAKLKAEAIEKKKLSDIYKLRHFQRSITKKENFESYRKLNRTVKKMTETKIPHISATPFEEPALDFVSSQDLSGNLRNIKPQGGGLMDHFTSLQRRGMATISAPKIVRKAKTKRYKLASHRMPWEVIERPVKAKKSN